MNQQQPIQSTMATNQSVELMPTGMSPEEAMQVFDRLGLSLPDLPMVLQAAQALVSAGAMGQPKQQAVVGNAAGSQYRDQLHGRPGANNPIPNQPQRSPEEAMMAEVFNSDRNRRQAAY